MGNNKDATKNLTNNLEKISNYRMVITVITILTGFVYLQGLYSNYTSKFTFWDLFTYVIDIPASIDIYITSGFMFLSFLLIQITISYIVINIINSIITIYKQKKLIFIDQDSKPKEELVRKNTSLTVENVGIHLGFILPVLCAAVFYLLYENIHTFRLFWLWVFNIIFITIIMYSFSVINQRKEYFQETKREIVYVVLKLFLTLSVALSSLFIVYYNGHKSQDIKLEKVLEGNSGFNFVKVYFTESSNMEPKGYYKLYLTKDYFVGYDDVYKKTIMIPNNIIKIIEDWNAVVPTKSVEKYVREKSNSKGEPFRSSSLQKDIMSVVENFYKFRTGNLYGKKVDEISADKVVNLITTQYYKSNFYLMNPDILEQKWSLSKEYNRKKLEDFCGFEMSVPEKNAEDRCYVYVLEVWKDFNEYLKYSLIKVNDLWYIDEIDKNYMPFEFL